MEFVASYVRDMLVDFLCMLPRKYVRMRRVRDDMVSLRSELTVLQAVIRDYMMVEDPELLATMWISKVRELASDIEDFFRKTSVTPGSRSRIADQIRVLKTRKQEIYYSKEMYKLDSFRCGTTVHAFDPRLHAHYVTEAELVGIDGPRDDLAKWMIEEGCSSKHRRVLSIVGFAGLGKTTLANMIYLKIRENFDCCAFVSVSQKPDIKRIIEDVISQMPCKDGFTTDIYDGDEMRYIEKLAELLHDKRYLIVIDDLWSTLVWKDAISYAFPENNFSSRIIVTTRNVDVARLCCLGGNDRLYEMDFLSDLMSRRLFYKRVFGSEDYCPDMLKEVSDEILDNCGGLPLEIIGVSHIFANIPALKEDWEKVTRSIVSVLDENRSLHGVNRILSFSYNDLSPELKTCFLYLSMFPEGYVIHREWLVRLWIAEGFIPEDLGQSCQETAENYFQELINRSVVHPVDIGYDGKARACRVHAMMLRFIISKSAKENLTTVVGVEETSPSNSESFIRRLSVQRIDQEHASVLANEDLSHVRSLKVASSVCIKHLPGLAKFEALCVLDFDDCEGLEEYTASGMDKLSQLRYLRLRGKTILALPQGIVMLRNVTTLDLSGTRISSLPPEIVMLHDLEVLDLRGTKIKELPAEIVQLTEIQELHISSEPWTEKGKAKIPDGIGNMRKLQAVSGFSITDSSIGAVEELGNLTNLSELHIELNHGGSEEYKRHEQMLLSSLCQLGTRNLRSLWIHKCRGLLEFLDSWSPVPSSLETFRMSGGCCFTNIPKWMSPALTGLVHLEISLPEFREEVLHTFGELPALLYLRLTFLSDPVEVIAVQGTTGFPCLNKFAIYSVAGGHVTFMEGAMPRLEKVNVRIHVSLAKKYDFHLGIQHLPSLKEVAVTLYEVDATPYEIRAAAAAIRNEACIHPRRPTIDISGKCYERQREEISSDEEDLR